MNLSDLISVCAAAFVGVFIILAVLAVVMRLILIIFPEKAAAIDAILLAAITTAAGRQFPGKRITKVEEIT